MNSAIGNFDGKCVRMSNEQTPDRVTVDRAYFDLLERVYHTKVTDTPVITTEGFDTPFSPIAAQGITINVLDYITAKEWDTFCALLSAMFANGASVCELQQRIMGLL